MLARVWYQADSPFTWHVQAGDQLTLDRSFCMARAASMQDGAVPREKDPLPGTRGLLAPPGQACCSGS